MFRMNLVPRTLVRIERLITTPFAAGVKALAGYLPDSALERRASELNTGERARHRTLPLRKLNF